MQKPVYAVIFRNRARFTFATRKAAVRRAAETGKSATVRRFASIWDMDAFNAGLTA